MRILIADDDPVSRRLLERTLLRLGHDVVAVSDGAGARDALLDPKGPRLAILDWMMPGLDGLEVCRAVRVPDAPYVYVILLTARTGHEDLVTGLSAEADDFLVKPFNALELEARIQSGARILDLQATLLAAQDTLRREATHDRLTGLWNRGMTLDHLGRECQRAGRMGNTVSVALADIDHFKQINDTYGHDAGDAVLQAVAGRMRAAIREADAIGRYGGEEFLLVLAPASSAEAAGVAERVRRGVADTPIPAGRAVLSVTVSVGVASAPGYGSNPTALISTADAALYRAKASGRNRIETARGLPLESRRTSGSCGPSAPARGRCAGGTRRSAAPPAASSRPTDT